MKLIDGSALEKAVASYIFEDAKLSIPQLLKNGDLLMVCEIISHFPAVDAVPDRHGKWTRHTVGSAEYGTTVMYRCNACDMVTISKFKYCPHCGARMDDE